MQTKKLIYIDQTSFDNGAKYIWGYLRGYCIVVARIIVIDAQKQRKSQVMMAFNGNVNK